MTRAVFAIAALALLATTAHGQSDPEANTSIHIKTITLHSTLEDITGLPAPQVFTPAPVYRGDLDVVRYNVLATPQPVGKTVLGYEPGGFISVHDRRWRDLAAKGGAVEITGLCQSACTIILGYIPKERLCIGKEAYFNFHLARYATNDNIDLSATQWMIDRYPTEVQSWINARGGIRKMPAHGYWTLTASELWKMGYRRCGS